MRLVDRHHQSTGQREGCRAPIFSHVPAGSLGREDFRVEPRLLRRGLLDNGYVEIPVTSQHAVGIDSLPPLHKDPFDRLLLAQALSEGITLLTSDGLLAQHAGPVRKV